MMKDIKVIAFDADDTLWVNEPYFRETENKFCELLEEFYPNKLINKELFKIEMDNLPLYGYGIKGFILNMMETILLISDGKVKKEIFQKTLDLGKEMYNKPIEILEFVPEVLKTLKKNYRLVVATKGDLLDQERKLVKSGLSSNFHHIEIMSNKNPKDYQKLLKNLDCKPENFLMIGNSLKSDILPVLEIGAYAIHIPFHTTWIHEEINYKLKHPKFIKIDTLDELIPVLGI